MIQFWIPMLPLRALSPNGGQRSRRNPWELSEAKLELGDCAYHALLAAYAPNIPVLATPVIVTVTLHAAHGKKPKDGRYRPEDPSNVGGDVLKPIMDYALVRLCIIPDDDYRYVAEVQLRIVHVDELRDEGIMVEVVEQAVAKASVLT